MKAGKIHETACIGQNAVIGAGTSVWQHSIIQDGAVIGNHCNIGANVYIEAGVIIGNRVKMKNNIAVYTGVIVEDDVFLGPDCVFTNVINPRSFIDRKNEFKSTIVKKGSTVGANATVICGNTIGKYAMVAAGTVVTKDVPDYALVIGSPGKTAGYVCECGCRLNEKMRCGQCLREYEMDGQGFVRELRQPEQEVLDS